MTNAFPRLQTAFRYRSWTALRTGYPAVPPEGIGHGTDPAPAAARMRTYEAIRAAGGALWGRDGQLYVLGYDVSKQVLGGPAFSVAPRGEVYSVLSGLDGEPQRVVRALLAAAFAPKALAPLARRLHEDAARRLGAFAEADTPDLVTDFVRPLLLRSASHLLGLRDEPMARLLFWYPDLLRFVLEGAGGGGEVDRSFRASVTALYGRVRSGEEGGFLHGLMQLPGLVEAYPVFERAVADLVTAVVWSTGNIIASSLQALLLHPDVEAALQADRTLMPAFLEEVGRLKAADITSAREAIEDVEVAGQPVRAGQRVVVLAEAANRDPAAFDAPDAFRLGRPQKSLSFGHGLHYCVGRYWGLAQATTALTAILDGWPRLSAAVAPGAPPYAPFLETYLTSLPMAAPPRL